MVMIYVMWCIEFYFSDGVHVDVVVSNPAQTGKWRQDTHCVKSEVLQVNILVDITNYILVLSMSIGQSNVNHLFPDSIGYIIFEVM